MGQRGALDLSHLGELGLEKSIDRALRDWKVVKPDLDQTFVARVNDLTGVACSRLLCLLFDLLLWPESVVGHA